MEPLEIDRGNRSAGGDGRPEIAPSWLNGVIWTFVGLGLALRLVRFLVNYPIWHDEAFVAVNFLDRDYIDLLRPLNYSQVCPLLFLWIELTAVQIMGIFGVVAPLIPDPQRARECRVVLGYLAEADEGLPSPPGRRHLRRLVHADPARGGGQAVCVGPPRGPASPQDRLRVDPPSRFESMVVDLRDCLADDAGDVESGDLRRIGALPGAGSPGLAAAGTRGSGGVPDLQRGRPAQLPGDLCGVHEWPE